MPDVMRRSAAVFLGLAGLLGLLAIWAPDHAFANSRFTVDNQSDGKLTVTIFNGNDATCDIAAKTHHVGAGNKDSFGCEGGGNQRCKVKVQEGGHRACSDLYWECSDQTEAGSDTMTITIHNGGTLQVAGADGSDCECVDCYKGE